MDSLCWYCQKAYGRCEWSRKEEPVVGWVAIRNDLPGITGASYCVCWCPLFETDRRMETEQKNEQQIVQKR
jgi:hypothetical protein